MNWYEENVSIFFDPLPVNIHSFRMSYLFLKKIFSSKINMRNKEYKDLMSQLYADLCLQIRNYNAYLILALFDHHGHCITIAKVSLQFKRYSLNSNTLFNHSQRSHISQFQYQQ